MDAAGGLPVFPNAGNPGNHLNLHMQQQQQNQQQLFNHQQQQQLQLQLQQQQQQLQHQPEQLNPKRQAVVDRLKRRIETYRRRQSDCTPRFEQTFSGVCEQQTIETNQLQKRFLESKAKRQAKNKTDKNKADNSTLGSNLQSSVHVQQKFLKRPADDRDGDSFEPPLKLQHNGSENLTKFSVEIVQQLEFTTSAANSQPQQISTNVTVKALTNASVKSDGSSTNPQQQQSGTNQQTQQQQQQQNQSNGNTNNQNTANNQQNHHQQPNATPSPAAHMHDLGNIVDFKQEPDNDFADLEQCAAALEKDVAANGGHFPGLSDLIGDDTVEENDTFKELISDLSDFHPELLLNFEEKPKIEVKLEDGHMRQQQQLDNLSLKNSGSPLTQYSMHAPFNDQSNAMNKQQQQRAPYNPNGSLNELSPAAQTLKHMAEQHQVKNAMNNMGQGGYGRQTANPNMQQNQQTPQQQQQVPNAGNRFNDNSPYNQPSFNEYLNTAPNPNANAANAFHKNNVQPFPGADMIKQEMMGYNANDFDLKRLSQMTNQKLGGGGFTKNPVSNGAAGNNQQYSPYGSPGSGMNGSPAGNFMPNRQQGNNTGASPRPNAGQQQQQGANNVPQGNMTLNMKQTQQLNISQQGPGGHGIQVSAGQHLHLSSDLKNGGVSVAAQQGMYFNQQATNQNQSQPNQQQNQQQQQQQHNSGVNNGGNSHNNSSNSQQNHQNSNPNGAQNDSFSVSQSQSINFGGQSLRQQRPNQHNNSQQQSNNSVVTPMSGGNIATDNSANGLGGNGMNPTMGGMSANGMGSMNGAAQMSGGMMGNNPTGMQGMGPATNAGGAMNSMNNMCMGAGNGGNMRTNAAGMMNNGNVNQGMTNAGAPGMNHDQMKYMQQQRMMQVQMQQRMMAANNRGPPPEYKAPVQGMMNQAQMMAAQHQGGGRFPTAAAMRRMSQQPIPPSGPMMRGQHPMYMQQRSMNVAASGYAGAQRPPNVQVGPEGMPMSSQANQEWRQLLMQQQQNMSFNNSGGNMRPNPNTFNQGNPGQNSFPMQNQSNAVTGNNPTNAMQQMNPHLQQQLLRSQQQNQNSQPMQQQQMAAQQNPALSQQLQNQMQQQQQQQQQMMNQMNVMSAMSQTQTMTIQQQQSLVNGQFVATQSQQQTQTTTLMQQQQQSMQVVNNAGNGGANSTNNSNNVISSSDFNLDFLDSSGTFEAQDLLNSLDNENFNLQDIL
ncbi:neurogenic protein mastermind [Culicoides brevitarsis]|uniref:neurogenic protein mastermind n=1 Tax=Culicoides brevitarsis TaxID=469753 RepID=UPI00307BC003